MFLATPSLPSPASLPPFVIPFPPKGGTVETRIAPTGHRRPPRLEPEDSMPCRPLGWVLSALPYAMIAIQRKGVLQAFDVSGLTAC